MIGLASEVSHLFGEYSHPEAHNGELFICPRAGFAGANYHMHPYAADAPENHTKQKQ